MYFEPLPVDDTAPGRNNMPEDGSLIGSIPVIFFTLTFQNMGV